MNDIIFRNPELLTSFISQVSRGKDRFVTDFLKFLVSFQYQKLEIKIAVCYIMNREGKP